jgi:hypothetical protein
MLAAVWTVDVGGEVTFVDKVEAGVSGSEAALAPLGSDITWTAGAAGCSEAVLRGGTVVEELGRTARTSEVVIGSDVVIKGPDGVAGVTKGWVEGMDADAVETRGISVVDSSNPV